MNTLTNHPSAIPVSSYRITTPLNDIILTITKTMERRNKMQISTIVKDLMAEQKLTLTDLSSMSGVATSTLSDLLNNKHTPTLKTIKRVMRALV